MISLRGGNPLMARCLRCEFEDVVAAVDGVTLEAPSIAEDRPDLARRAVRRLAGAAPGASLLVKTGLAWARAARLEALRRRRDNRADYDVAYVGCSDLSDLQALVHAPWRGTARTTVCFVDDLYAARDRSRTGELALLKEFDHVFTGCEGSVRECSAILGRPAHFLPFSVDTLEFCPWPDPPERTIDVYAMGRRNPATHEACLDLAARTGWFYLYDTAINARITSHVEHRRRLISLITRSRYFLVNPGKISTGEIHGQEEAGYRFFEGAAAGAVLVGQSPTAPSFTRLFDWPDAVIHLPCGGSDIEGAIASLERDPDRVERIRRTNVAQCLRRHDHVHRWAQVLATVGLPPTGAMQARMDLLASMAAQVEAGLEPAHRHRVPAGTEEVPPRRRPAETDCRPPRRPVFLPGYRGIDRGRPALVPWIRSRPQLQVLSRQSLLPPAQAPGVAKPGTGGQSTLNGQIGP